MAGAKTDATARPRLVVGISGATGAVYGVRVLKAAQELGLETHLVITKAAVQTLDQETGLKPADLSAMASVTHRLGDIGASIASGSFPTLIVAPCSVRTLSEIATGMTTSLLTRAADVTLKERRPLVLMVRETPFHLGHLRTMVRVTEMGAVVAPPLPAFYAKPQSLDDMIDQSVGRALDPFGLDWRPVKRWGEDIGPGLKIMSFWDWAVKAYGRPGVAEACLELQDRHGQSIPYLLWAAWAAADGRAPNPSQLAAAAALASDWDAAAVHLLRQARRRLKPSFPDVPDAARIALREQIKAVELGAEHVLMDALEALAPPRSGAAPLMAQALAAACAAWPSPTPAKAIADLAAKLDQSAQAASERER